MGLLGLRRKPWKDADPKKRLAGVIDVPRTDQGTLFQLASQDTDQAVRLAAARRIKSVSYLERLLTGNDQDVIGVARERLAGVAVTEIKSRNFNEAQTLLDQVNEQSSLTEIILQASDVKVREAALVRLLKMEEPSQSLLARVAVQIEDSDQALRALAVVQQRQLLKNIAKKAKLEAVRNQAQAVLAEIKADADKPSAEKQRRERAKQFSELIKCVQPLTATTHPEEALASLDKLKAQWKQIEAEFTEVSVDEKTQELVEQFNRFSDRVKERVTEIHQEAAAAVQAHEALIACCKKWEERRAELGASVDAATLSNLSDAASVEWSALSAHEAGLDARFAAIFKVRFTAPIESAVDHAASAGVELSAADQAAVETILEEANALINAEEWRDADYRYKVLHKDWSRLTIDLPFEHPLRKGFHDAYVAFKNACFQRREERRLLQESNLKVLEALLNEAKALVAIEPAEEALRAHLDNLKALQERWKVVKPVPFREAGPLRQEFRKLCDKAFEPLRAHREEEEWRGFANITLAEEIIERAHALVQDEANEETLNAIKALQQEWKDMGRLPRERQEELWNTFKAAGDQVFEHLKPYFDERDKDRVVAYEAKQVLLAELTAICDQDQQTGHGPDGKDERLVRVARVKEIQEEWKAAGPVPRDRDKEQWTEYKKLLDSFFGRRRKQFEHMAEEQTENLHQKLALIAEAEELAENAAAWKSGEKTDVDEPALLREVKSLQTSWKQIGHIPKEKVEDIWNKFRSHCDKVYEVLADWFSAMDIERKENLRLKNELLAKIEAYTKEADPTTFREEVKVLQAEWRAIGYIPREAMDDVMGRYQALCNIIFNVVETNATDTAEQSPEAVVINDEKVQVSFAFGSADTAPASSDDVPQAESSESAT